MFTPFQVANTFRHHQREWTVALAYAVLLAIVGAVSPSFYSAANVRDLILSNAPVLVAAMGMTLVIIAGQIDISIGAQFAIAGVAAGMLAKAGLPMPLVALAVSLLGGLMGTINGALTAGLRIPSIVVTLATMVALRDGLRWVTEGAWVQNLPANFQWFGVGQSGGQLLIVLSALILWAAFGWSLRNLVAGREVYATGSDEEAARLAGIKPRWVGFSVFALTGVLTGIAALLNSIRFMEVQGNAGVGLEMQA